MVINMDMDMDMETDRETVVDMVIPVLEIDYRGYHGRRTKDIWEDQKPGGPKT